MASTKLNRQQNENNRSFDIVWKRIVCSWVVVFIMGIIFGTVLSTIVFAINGKDRTYETHQEEPKTEDVFPTYEIMPMVVMSAPTPIEEPIEIEPEEPEEPEQKLLGNFRITAYCSCRKCCGKWADNRPNGIVYGAMGKELKAGVSVASPLPFGTKIHIDGLGDYVVQDRTADWVVEKYGEGIVDIYFDSHEEAKQFGLKHLDVYIDWGE